MQGYKAFRSIMRDIHARQRSRQAAPKPMNQLHLNPAHEKDARKHLNRLYMVISKHQHFDGHDDNGDLKALFGRQGKKAFTALAEYLGLEPYEIRFNPGGVAVSGDLVLHGMVTPTKGVYLSLNKDGMMEGVLYRKVSGMKDYSGDINHYFPEKDLADPAAIARHLEQLLVDGSSPAEPEREERITLTDRQRTAIMTAEQLAAELQRLLTRLEDAAAVPAIAYKESEADFRQAEADWYAAGNGQKAFLTAEGVRKSLAQVRLEVVDGIYEEGGTVRKGIYRYGADDTDFGSKENFLALLKAAGMSPQVTEGHYKGYLYSPRAYLWKGPGIHMVTRSNPLTENGEASFIAIAGNKEPVETAIGYIELHTESNMEDGHKYISFDDLTFDDDLDAGQFPAAPTGPPDDDPHQPANSAELAVRLYYKIKAGEEIGQLPELFGLFSDSAVKKELKGSGKNMSEIYGSETFRAALKQNLWDLVPVEYKKTSKVSPVDWEPDPKDPGLQLLVKDFVGHDQLNKRYSGANFDDHGIAATDGQKLLFLNKTRTGAKGIFCVSKDCFKSYGADPAQEVKIDETFPDYLKLVHPEIRYRHQVRCELLKGFAQTVRKAGLFNPDYAYCLLRYGPDAFIRMQPGFLESAADVFLRLGIPTIELGITRYNKAVFIAPGGHLDDVPELATSFAMLMPMVPLGYYDMDKQQQEDYHGAQHGELYFDLEDHQVYTYGISQAAAEAAKPAPWQTPRKAFMERVAQATSLWGSYPSELTDNLRIVAVYESPQGGSNEFSLTKPTVSKARHYAGLLHEALIRQRLSQGEHVPENVLADYPGLEARVTSPSGAASEPIKSNPPVNEKNTLMGDGWFKQHPEKILGNPYETTNRFGKPVTRVKGNMENAWEGFPAEIRKLVPDEAPPATTGNGPLVSHDPQTKKILSDPARQQNVSRVVKAEQKARTEKALRELSGEAEPAPKEQLSFQEVMATYNQGITEAEIQAWVWYKRRHGGLNDETTILDKSNGWSRYVIPLAKAESYLREWLKQGIVCWYQGDYLPSVLYYGENILERQATLEQDKATILEKFGEAQYTRQREGLLKTIPRQLSLSDPNPENRLFINPDSSFVEDIRIDRLADGTPLRLYLGRGKGYQENNFALLEAFKTWLRSLPRDQFKKTTDHDIIQYYLEGKSPGSMYDKEEKLRLRQNAKREGDVLFGRFLAEALEPEDQQKIEARWNGRFNGYAEINYTKIPIGFTCSATFKNKPLHIRPAQREALGFISVHGSGCIAYDVGLGKTLTAILAIAQAIEMGQCKRPFIVVPNQTYKNWLSEIRGVMDKGETLLTGILPQYQVNDLYNLGEDHLAQVKDETGQIRPVPEKSISVITYEGFNRLSLGEETWSEIGFELFMILEQGGNRHRKRDGKNQREKEQLKEKVESLMGKGIRGGMVEVEQLGFDFMAVDEAHAMKKSFTQVKGEVRGEEAGENAGKYKPSHYEINSGDPSMTAVRGFMMSQYILRNNHMRNVLLLTATPFTNSPLEIYSMLALIGYQQLEKSGINNIKEFFDTYIRTSNELVINAKLKPQRKEVVMGFNNLVALQQLIFKFILYKTGEEAGIQRPKKVVLPQVNHLVGGKLVPLPPEEQVSTNLPMTAQQKRFMADVERYVLGKVNLSHFCLNPAGLEDEDENKAAAGSAGENLDEANLNDDEASGTRLLRGMSFARQLALSPYLYACNPDQEPTAEKYIETSPKLKYVMECIRSVKKYHEDNDEEVSGQVIYMNAGVHYFPLIKTYLVKNIGYADSEVGIISSGMSASKKEGIKERFLAGSVKVIIGSASIKEGINLQNRSTVLYNCWLDWNPTDIKQLEGRIWRFGNRYANVRIVNPLVEDSIDTFIFQKLQEKTSRINEIWYRAGHSNTLHLDEFNPAELKVGLVTDPEALAELLLVEEREHLTDDITGIRNQVAMLKKVAKHRDELNGLLVTVRSLVNRYRPQEAGARVRSNDTLIRLMREFLDDPDQAHTEAQESLYYDFRWAWSVVRRGLAEILQPRGLDIHFDLAATTGKLEAETKLLEQTREQHTGEEAVKMKAAEIVRERKQRHYQPKSVMERVGEFARLNPRLLSELMVYDQDETSQQERHERNELGRDLEAAADNLDDLEAIIRDMEEMEALLAELEALPVA